MKKFIFLLSFSLFTLPLTAQTETNLFRAADKSKMNHWVDSVFDTMSLDERIGQLFMVIANPAADTRNMQKLTRYINDIKVGGILFAKAGSPQAQAEVTNRLQKASRVPLFIALDGEWGLSMRLNGTTRFPRNMTLGAIENDTLLEIYGKEVGRQCKEMRIQINFAPALDVNSNRANPVIGNRAFGEDPDLVSDKGLAYCKGLESAGIIPVAKHFPGHGDTSDDSHHTLPVIHHSRQRLDSVELLPFKRYIYDGYPGIMTSHLYVPSLDKTKDMPATFSKPIVTDLLQKEFGFQGLLFTDALAMKGALVKKGENISVKALQAGNDILVSPATPITDFEAVKEAIEKGTLDLKDIERRVLKVLQYKYITGLANYRPIQTKGLSERINTPHAAWLAAKLNEEGITLLKNTSGYIPLKELDKKKIAAVSLGDSKGNEFQKMLNRYDSVSVFSLGRNATAAEQLKVYAALEAFDLIICGIHTVRIPESEPLRKLAEKKDVILTFFTQPYFSKDYKKSADKAKAVIMAYETSQQAQRYAAQLIFGGMAAKGKLPVSIPGMYFSGTGVFTEKTRLGYHEPEETGANMDRLHVIDGIVKEALEAKAFPGCQVLVAQDGLVIYDKSFGYYTYDKKQRVDEYSVYDLASVSKAAGTLLAVMKLYDEKNFTLTNKISDYIPELKDSDKKDILIKDLLYHQSGVVPTIAFHTNKNLPNLVSDTAKPGFRTEVASGFYLHDSFRDTVINEIKTSKLGTKGKYLYSCINFIILQKMVEAQTKEPLDKLLHANFYRRLGAAITTYNPLKTIDTLRIVPTEDDRLVRRQLLRGYVHDEAAAFQGGVSGNAGLFSNVNDLAKILQLFLNQGAYGGERYLSAETSRLFTQSKSPVSRRGLGFDKPAVGTPKLSPCGALAPASVYGHTGYTGTCFWVDPDNRLIYIFLCNRVTPTRANNKLSSLEIRTRIQDAIYKAIDRKTQKDS
ncbi:MAG: serine hydrolase [Tannerellaceae bacterium]|jgi:beta-glucosidase-like glycosyl hydrolase/CubicO group peptidase (beta-lactamase class C family)|nr:serine hydrolase [Tannerellaceae bacterium]